jgi:hypothetical protein
MTKARVAGVDVMQSKHTHYSHSPSLSPPTRGIVLMLRLLSSWQRCEANYCLPRTIGARVAASFSQSSDRPLPA